MYIKHPPYTLPSGPALIIIKWKADTPTHRHLHQRISPTPHLPTRCNAQRGERKYFLPPPPSPSPLITNVIVWPQYSIPEGMYSPYWLVDPNPTLGNNRISPSITKKQILGSGVLYRIQASFSRNRIGCADRIRFKNSAFIDETFWYI